MLAQATKKTEQEVLTQTRTKHKGWFQLREETLTTAIATRNAAMGALFRCGGDTSAHQACRQTLRKAHSAVKAEVKLVLFNCFVVYEVKGESEHTR